ncbi:MAG: class I SAM-dependent methyltransferase [Pseudomonadota bacterium]
MQPSHEVQFTPWMPFFQPGDWKGKTFLDVGCGMGRNSYWPMTWGAVGGCAMDLDDRSPAAARRNLAEFPTLSVEKRSVYGLEDEDLYDVVFSIGVIHHIQDPDAALAKMVRAARPGGEVCAWVSGYENNEWIVRWFNPARKALFSRLPVGLTHRLSLFPAAALWAGLRLGLGRTEYTRLLKTFEFPYLRAIVFDQMIPRIAQYWRREEVEALMTRAGLSRIRLQWVNEISWAAMGIKE